MQIVGCATFQLLGWCGLLFSLCLKLLTQKVRRALWVVDIVLHNVLF